MIIYHTSSARPELVRAAPFPFQLVEKSRRNAHERALAALNVVRLIRKNEFSLAEVYGRASDLARLHPHNRHIRDKIRQQLQALRDLGIVEFLGRGRYRL